MAKLTEALKGASTILMAIVVAIMFVLLSPSGFAAETENVSYRCSCGKVFSSEAKWRTHKEKCDAILVEETVPTTTTSTTAPTTTTPTVASTTAAPTTTPTTAPTTVPVTETVKATEEPTTETTFIVPVIDLSPYEEEVVAQNTTATMLASPESTTTTVAAEESTTKAESTTVAETTTAPTTTVSENTTGVATSDAFYADAEPTTPNEEDVLFPNTGSISRGVIAAIAVAASSICVIVTLKKKDT